MRARTPAAPFYPGQQVIARRQPLFPAHTVTRCFEIAPGVWRIEWECRPCAEASAVTGSGPAAGYEPILAAKAPALLRPPPEIFDTGKVRLGSGSITASFPPLPAKVAR